MIAAASMHLQRTRERIDDALVRLTGIALRPSVMPLLIAGACLAFTYVALARPVLGLGAIYGLLFGLVAWSRPQYALLLTFALSPFQNDLSVGLPVSFSIAEINLALTAPVFFARNLLMRKPIYLGPIAAPLFLLFGVSVFASTQGWRSTTTVSLAQMVLYLVLAVSMFASLVRRPTDLLIVLRGLVVVCVVLAMFGLASGASYYLGLHKNGVGASLACGLMICAELFFSARSQRQKLIYACAAMIIAPALVLTLSRGAWVSALVGLIVIGLLRRQTVLMLQLGVLLLPILLIGWNALPQEQREYATGFDQSHFNIQARYESVEIAATHFFDSPIYGKGVGLRKEYDATNVAMLTLAETGLLGLGAFGLLHVAVLAMIWRAHRLIDRTDPRFTFIALAGALILSRLAHGMVDHYWSRGAIMVAWASVGMATCVYLSLRRPPRESLS